jgi:hypothetical protein
VKRLAGAVLFAALLAGCGGGGGDRAIAHVGSDAIAANTPF